MLELLLPLRNLLLLGLESTLPGKSLASGVRDRDCSRGCVQRLFEILLVVFDLLVGGVGLQRVGPCTPEIDNTGCQSAFGMILPVEVLGLDAVVGDAKGMETIKCGDEVLLQILDLVPCFSLIAVFY